MSEWRPESEAPTGRWVLAKALPATKFLVPAPSPPPKGFFASKEKPEVWTNVASEDRRPAVKLGGSWWMWTKDHKTLEEYRVSNGRTVGPYPILVGCWADQPDEWCDIPDGVLPA